MLAWLKHLFTPKQTDIIWFNCLGCGLLRAQFNLPKLITVYKTDMRVCNRCVNKARVIKKQGVSLESK